MEPVATASKKWEPAGTSRDFKAPQFGKHSKRLASARAGCVPCSSRKQIRRRGTHNKWEPMNGSPKAATLIDQRDSPYDMSERKRGTESGEGARTRSEIRCRFTQTKNSQEVVDVCPLERFVATSSTVCPQAAATPRLASSCSPFANSLPTIRQTSQPLSL